MRSHYLIHFSIAFGLMFLATPLFAWLARKTGFIDQPSARKFHLTPVPLLGGAGLAVSFFIAALAGLGVEGVARHWGILAACAMTLALGLVDDRRGISPGVKLMGQIAAAVVLILSGVQARVTGIWALDLVLTFVWVCGIINAVNLLDNIDGLSSGTGAIGGCFLFLVAVASGKTELALICIVFSGACLGFLPFNFHPASIFLGDAGSMFMGMALAACGLAAAEPASLVSGFVPPVVLGLLVFDTGLVSILRLANGRKITDAGKDHTSHRLCNLGLGVQGAVLTLFAVDFLFGFSGLAMHRSGDPQKAMLIPLTLFFIAAISMFLLKDAYRYDAVSPRAGRDSV